MERSRQHEKKGSHREHGIDDDASQWMNALNGLTRSGMSIWTILIENRIQHTKWKPQRWEESTRPQWAIFQSTLAVSTLSSPYALHTASWYVRGSSFQSRIIIADIESATHWLSKQRRLLRWRKPSLYTVKRRWNGQWHQMFHAVWHGAQGLWKRKRSSCDCKSRRGSRLLYLLRVVEANLLSGWWTLSKRQWRVRPIRIICYQFESRRRERNIHKRGEC